MAGFDMFSSSSHEIMKVNQYIRDETGVDFNGTRMMVTEWNGVASDSSNLVSLHCVPILKHLLLNVLCPSAQAVPNQHFSRHPDH